MATKATGSKSGRKKMPEWWHKDGYEMEVERIDKDKNMILIVGMRTRVKIIPRSIPSGGGWFVEWEKAKNLFEWIRGRILFTSDDLKAAFGLRGAFGESDDWLIKRFGPEVIAIHGEYIRQGNFLCIPCFGTGHNGDSNVSVFITEAIQDAIRKLLE